MASTDIIDIYFKIGVDDRPLNEGLDGASKKASSFGDVLKANLVSTAITKGLGLLIDGFKKLGSVIEQNMGTAVARLDTLNSYSKTMEALGFSTEQAKEAQDKLSDAIDGLPTTLDGIVSWQQQFTALSDDIEGSTDLTIALNNATLAAGKGQEVANNAMANWYAIISSGTPDAQHWQSIYSAMPAQINLLAESLLGAGAKSDDLFQAWKDGEVTVDDVTSALVALNEEGLNGVASYADQAQIGAQTIQTAYGNISTAIGKNIAKVLDVLNGDTAQGGGRIVELLLNVKNLINEIGTAVANFVSEHEPQISAIMDALNTILKGGDIASNLKTIKDNITTVLGDALNVIISALPEVFKVATAVVEVLATAIVENAPALITALIEIITNIVTWLAQPDMVSMLANGAVAIVTALADGISMALPVLTPAVASIVYTLINTLTTPENMGLLLNSALLLLGAIVMALAQTIPVMINYVTGMLKNIGELFSAAVFWVSENIAPALVAIAYDLSVKFYTWLFSIFKGIEDFGYNLGMWLKGLKTSITDWFNNLINGIKTWWNNLITDINIRKSTIKTNIFVWWNNLKNYVLNGLSALLSGVTNFGTNLWNKLTSIWDKAVSVVKDAIDNIKGMFDFEWSLPKIKLPHFSVTGSLDLLADPPKLPSVSVSWYKKAMDEPYLLNGATIFGKQNGKLLGGGEAGSELVVGTNKLMSMIKEATGGREVNATFNIYASEGQDIRELAKEVTKEIQNLIDDKEKAYA